MGLSTVDNLPPELIEHILLICDPLDVAAFGQTSRYFHALTDTPHFWRLLYLAQPLDDPQTCVSQLGTLRQNIGWKRELQRVVRARTVVSDITLCRPHERCAILHTLLDLISAVTPRASVTSDQISSNLLWVAAQLRGGSFLEHDLWVPSEAEVQLRARLHASFGLTQADAKRSKRTESRAYVYNMRNYRWDNDFGPFMMDGSGRVNWVHIQALHHVMSMHLVDFGEDEEFEFAIFPMSLPFCQSIMPLDLDLDRENDWAGVEGLWRCTYCFCDHRELLIYNNFNTSLDDRLDPSIFEDPEFTEVYRAMDVHFRVIGTEPDMEFPARPKINFIGSMDSHFTMVGWVKLTPDAQIRWHFVAGEQGQVVWNSDGVQVGSVRSPFGVLGAWSTVFHDDHDPVGPFWLHKITPAVEE